MSKNLRLLKILAKVGRIVSLIVFVGCIVGAVMTVVGMILMAAGVNLHLGSIKLIVLELDADWSTSQTYCFLIVAVITMISNIVMSWFAARYFKAQIAAATPFTNDNATATLRLGLIIIITTAVAGLLASLVLVIGNQPNGDVVVSKIDGLRSDSSMVIGIAFLILSVFLRYGAEKIPAEVTTDTTETTAQN